MTEMEVAAQRPRAALRRHAAPSPGPGYALRAAGGGRAPGREGRSRRRGEKGEGEGEETCVLPPWPAEVRVPEPSPGRPTGTAAPQGSPVGQAEAGALSECTPSLLSRWLLLGARS